MGFVTAFAGRRDGYEVPAAFSEHGKLDGLVTDYFAGRIDHALAQALPATLSSKVRGRSDPRLPPERIYRLHGIAIGTMVSRGLGISPDVIYERVSPVYGERAADLARKLRSDLFMYSIHADAAFSARYSHDPYKVLFQFHPHIAMEREIINTDLALTRIKDPTSRQTLEGTLDPGPVRLASDEAWRLADQIICTSNFTKRSLVAAGADSERIAVIPYGIYLPEPSTLISTGAEGHFKVLFVGTGLYRKGLHHLLKAWEQARLPKSASLDVVARTIEPSLLAQLRRTAGVTYRAGVSQKELEDLYQSSSLFAMPSLVEGFGQVFLEALAYGLPVLGTPNTSVPDLGSPEDGAFVVPVSDVDSLTAMLEHLAIYIPANPRLRLRAQETARRFTWKRFREKIVQASTPQ